MVVINFLQAALLDRLHSFVWITGFPLVVFILALLGIAVFVWRSWGRLKAEWHAAEAPEHIAWIGIILAILSTIIICEFLYMPLVAVPAWHRIQWTSTMSISNTTGFPAIVVVGAGENNAAQFTGVECDFQGIHGGWDCTTSGVKLYDDGEYVTVNTTDQPNELINNSVDGSNAVLHLTIYTTYNSSASPGLYIGFFDPSINFNMTDFLYVCGNPPVYHCILPLVSTSTYLSFHAETYRLEDDVGALKEERETSDASADQMCSSQVLGLTSYTYFDGTYDTLSMGEGIMNGTCDVAYGNADVKDCTVTVQLAMASSLVTTQTSRRGTDALKILIDEGSKLGGITFFTWFFSV
ncbi:hypothetical protein B0A55_05646 [Friedmanniomyces simplex]|uniref:Uncharacterized protein n=1 Tax=Friedmanniomyces simplex TaxID=329884 RepID=A0A4U0XDI0_9PEZI|nr:hypothetical protein B0A55_05646 [Friedmanniomyces simplex]